MPTIPVNLGDVQAYENLPLGPNNEAQEYLGQIDKIVWKAPQHAGKFPQLMVTYTVIDGDQLGRTSNEWLSLSPKAAFRLKKWFAKFGLDDTENLEVDDDTNELTEPDLVGYQVIFKVFRERDNRVSDETADDAYRIRTELVSVEDDVEAPAPKAAAEPAEAEDDSDIEPAEEAAVAAAARPARRDVARAAKPARRQLR